MIMSNTPTTMNNQINTNNMNMMQMMGGVGNPYYMNPYVGYPPMLQPMMNYNYMSAPVYYNPHQMANNPPLNNYNRNIAGTLGSMPLPNFYANPISAPIKVVNPDYNQSNKLDMQSPQIIQRSISSKGVRSDNYQNNINNDVRYKGDKLIDVSSTNPDSFNRRRGYSSNSNSNSNNNYNQSYKPYSLKDYKDITSAKLVLGGLGANIGTKEWFEKQEKIKKMDEYSKNVKGKPIIKFVKETPIENFEKIKKEKIESSHRFKSYEYAKLVRTKPKSTYDSNSNDIGLIYNNKENNHKEEFINNKTINEENRDDFGKRKKLNIMSNNKNYHDINSNQRYIEENSNTKDYISSEQSSNNYSRGENMNYRHDSESNKDDLEFLKIQKQREILNLKLNEIKESLLK